MKVRTLGKSAHGLEINTLFVNGRREIRAKFPNGDPLLPGAAGGYSATAAGGLSVFSPTGVPFPRSVAVTDAAGKLLSTGGQSLAPCTLPLATLSNGLLDLSTC